MNSNEVQITNLLYRYAECIDGGDFNAAAELFAHAKIKFADRLIDKAEVLAIWEKYIIRYPDGPPRTKHVISNPIIEVDDTVRALGKLAHAHRMRLTDLKVIGARGALFLAGIATAVVIGLWLAFYLFVFVPRATP